MPCLVPRQGFRFDPSWRDNLSSWRDRLAGLKMFMPIVRPLSGLLLAMLMAITSVTMAVARGQDRMGTSVEICGGFGEVFITLNADGQPMVTSHSCPDCLGGVSALDLPGSPAFPQRPQVASRAPFAAVVIVAASLPQPQATARGPPSLI